MKRFRFDLASEAALTGEKRYSHSDEPLRVRIQVEVPDYADSTTAWALMRDAVIGGRWGEPLRIEILPSEEGDRW